MSSEESGSSVQPARLVPTAKTVVLKATIIAVVAVLLVVGGVVSYSYRSAPTASSVAAQEVGQTEAAFLEQSEVKSAGVNTDVFAEWRAARADHKIIAYAIANCAAFRKFGNVDMMPRQLFNALLMNLTPSGEHRFFEVNTTGKRTDAKEKTANTGARPDDLTASDNPVRIASSPDQVQLSGPQQTMIYLSDAITRARLQAADQASGNWLQMYTFSWVMLVISALATLFVTIKGSMASPDKEKEYKTWRRYMTVGYLAIVLSTIGTTLASVKQFYDPARTYKTGGAALVELRRLHTKLAFEFVRNLDPDSCNPEHETFQRAFGEGWQTLATVQAAVALAAANLQDADRIKLERPIDQNPRDPSGAGTRQASQPTPTRDREQGDK